MSGSGNDIPVLVTTGDSAQQVTELTTRISNLYKEVGKLQGAFSGLENGNRAVSQLTQTINGLARVLSTVSSDVTFLNAAAQAANNTARAARELNLQQTAREGNRVLSQAYRSSDPDRVARTIAVTERELNSARIRQEQANQAAAQATGREIRAREAEYKRLTATIETLTNRLERLRETESRLAAEARIAPGVANRVVSRRIRQAYDQGDEALEDGLARVRDQADAAAARRQSAERRAQLRRDEQDRRAEEARLNAIPNALERRRTNLAANAAAFADPTLRGTALGNQQNRIILGLEALDRAIRDTTGNFTNLRVAVAASNQQISAQASLQNALDPRYQAVQTQLGVASFRNRLGIREAVNSDDELSSRDAALGRQQTLTRLFGDGGAGILQVQAGLLANYAILNNLFSAFTNTSQAVINFDDALKNLQAISASTNAQMNTLRTTIIGVSQGTKFTAIELTETATRLAQAGLSVNEIGAVLRSVALLATATGTTLATSADITTTALTVFRIRADETARVADQMTAALNLSKLTIDQVALGFQYVGNTAAEAGLSLTETTAVLATLANQGIRSGSTIGTGTRQLLTDLSQPSEDLRKRLRELGIGMDEINVRANGLTGVLSNLQRAGFTSADAFATMEVRAAEVFTALLRGTFDMATLTQGIQSASGAADANAVQMTSLRNRFLQLTNTINALAFTMSGPLISGLGAVVTGMNSFLGAVATNTGSLTVFGTVLAGLATTAVISWLFRLISGLGLVQAATTATVATFTAYSAALTSGAAGTAAMVLGVNALGLAMRALPLLAIVGGVTALFFAMREGTSTTRALAEEQERLKTASSEAKSAYDTQRQALQSVDEFMSQTIARSRSFNDETKTAAERQQALNSQVEEARQRFGSLSGAVYQSITSYQQLIQVLGTVRRDLNLTAQAAALTARETAYAELSGAQAQLGRIPSATERLNTLSDLGFRRPTDALLRANPNARAGDIDILLPQLPEGVRNNPEVRRALELALRSGAPSSAEETNRLRQYFGPTGEGRNLGLSPQLLSGLRDQLTQLGNLYGNIGRLTAQTQFSENSVTRTQFEGSPAFDRASSLSREATELFNRLGDPNSASTLTERQSRLTTLQAELEQRFNALREIREGLSESEKLIFDNSIPVTDLNRIRSQTEAYRRTLTETEIGAGRRAATRTIEANQRAIDELRSRSAERRDPAYVRELQREGERLLNEREQLQLAAVPAQARQELGANAPTDVVEADIRAQQETIRSRIAEQRSQLRRELGRSVAEDLTQQIAGLTETYRTLIQGNNRGGQQGSRAEIAAQRGRIEALIRQRGDILGLSPEAISAQINRIDQQGIRAGNSAGSRAADLAASQRDERESRNRSQELARINRQTNTDITATLTPGRADRALVEAARRDTNLLTEGALQAAQRQVNEADIAADIAQIDIRTRQIAQLAELAERINANLRSVNAQIAALPPEGRRSAAEIQRGIDLTAERQTLQGVLEQTQDQQRNAETLRERAEILRARRSERDSGSSIGQGFEGAWMQLQNQFSPQGQARAWETDFLNLFNNARNGFGNFVSSVASGSKTFGQALKDMGKSLAEMAFQIASNRLISMLFGYLLKIGVSYFGGSGLEPGADPSSPDFLGANGGQLFGVEGAYRGGIAVQRFARGGMVSGTHFGRDSVPALLAPGEGVLNRRAVSMIGTDTVKAMNDGLMQRSNGLTLYTPPTREPDQVNVYVVAPNEKPTLGPKDIIAVVDQNILNSGSTKALIRQVAVGGL